MTTGKDRYGRRPIPEYYDTMYEDGYEPWEIMQAAHSKILKNYNERQQTQEDYNINIKSEVKVR